MEKTFFDYIASADSEKIHSQTIGWIFSENCLALSKENKANILQKITKSKCQFIIENTLVEINDIDILIICKDALVVIENKIKASESKSQLGKYYEIIENGALSHLKLNRERFYVYLTLYEEQASDKRYIDFNYNSMFFEIDSVLDKKQQLNRDYFILNDYLKTINQLATSINWVLTNSAVRKWVFENTKFKKENQTDDTDLLSDEIKYVISNGLVRQMQKFYFKKVKDCLTLDLNYFKVTFGSSSNNGEGLIQIDFLNLDYNHAGVDFQIGYQIQGSVVKINTSSKNYENSESGELHHQIRAHFEHLKKSVGFKRRNPPETKAYYSVSKPLPKNIYDYSAKDLALYIETEIKSIEKSVYKLWQQLK
ncbi:MAG: hypothetical protein FJY06_06485 [Bacteroidetes bacterium]|nr:hypothetical protein [Bacteroidota bacterium]MBM3455790.1 hypothetical protein [Bacteroidota bacterium]